MEKANSVFTAAQRLKQGTAQAHAAIEGAFPVMRPDFELKDYRELLIRLHGFYQPLEAGFLKMKMPEKIQSEYSQRRKLPLLLEDLRFFQVSEQELQTHPRKEIWLREPSLAQMLGTLYVLEGSTLGGQLISKHLKERFQFAEGRGTAFFSAYGPQTGLMWKRFQTLLNEHLDQETIIEDSIHAAVATFEYFGNWLRGAKAGATAASTVTAPMSASLSIRA